MLKAIVHSEDLMLMNIYAPNNITTTFTKQRQYRDTRRQNHASHRRLNTPSSVQGRARVPKSKKKTEDLNGVLNQGRSYGYVLNFTP